MSKKINNESSLSRAKGFTLIELLVVISIIGLLSAVVLASLNSARAKARDARRIADFATIQTALELFYDQTGSYPRTIFGRSTGSMQWAYFSECLEKGTELRCGFTISNYQPVISKVPQDPSRSTSDPLADDKTYRPVLPVGCDSAGQSYRIAALLETNHSALESDLDGS
ncbi:MAG: prepilin-type N-terminal cleavage/methylation domain-containing protein, partial [bacterium]|nr:prepilin-type N-terminal cleavage/methylation domain-containing protein [bacterium]